MQVNPFRLDGWLVVTILVLVLLPLHGVAQSVVPRVSLRFDQVELAEVVEQLAETWNKRALVLSGVGGAITVEFQDVPVSGAIKQAVQQVTGAVTCQMVCDTLVLFPTGADLRVAAIVVDGNESTPTATVLRNMRSKSGEQFDPRRVHKDMSRLLSLGFFRLVDLELEQGSQAEEITLTIHCVEQKSGLATVGHPPGPERWPDAVQFNSQP